MRIRVSKVIGFYLMATLLLMSFGFCEDMDREYNFDMEQFVQGTGFTSTYYHICAKSPTEKITNNTGFALLVKGASYGSGAYSMEGNVKSHQQVKCTDCQYVDPNDWKNLSNYKSDIEYVDDVSAAYAPRELRLGSFNGSQSAKWNKGMLFRSDYQGLNMSYLFSSVDAMSVGTNGAMSWKTTKRSSELDVDASVKGSGHFDIRKIETYYSSNEFMLDEDYHGSFSIERRAEVKTKKQLDTAYADWLPCCSGGWEGMTQAELTAVGSSGVIGCGCE